MGSLTGSDLEKIKDLFETPMPMMVGFRLGEYDFFATNSGSYTIEPGFPVSAIVSPRKIVDFKGPGSFTLCGFGLQAPSDVTTKLKFVIDGVVAIERITTGQNLIQIEMANQTNQQNNIIYVGAPIVFEKTLEVIAEYISGPTSGTCNIIKRYFIWCKRS